jgi:hypothetical protein
MVIQNNNPGLKLCEFLDAGSGEVLLAFYGSEIQIDKKKTS